LPADDVTILTTSGHLSWNDRVATGRDENPWLSEFMVIHEMLHTLGLGENPPSSFEITEQVMRRCR